MAMKERWSINVGGKAKNWAPRNIVPEKEREREKGRDERAEATGEDKCGVRGRVDELVSPGFPRLNVRTYGW